MIVKIKVSCRICAGSGTVAHYHHGHCFTSTIRDVGPLHCQKDREVCQYCGGEGFTIAEGELIKEKKMKEQI